MKIRILVDGVTYFVMSKKKNQPPVITPFEDRALDFANLQSCKNIRDDVLEYYPSKTENNGIIEYRPSKVSIAA